MFGWRTDILPMLLCFAASCATEPESGEEPVRENVVKVRDFGAVPDDDKCDRQAIADALAAAQSRGASAIVFESGVYDLEVGDAESVTAVQVTDMDSFTLQGATDSEGNPATVFLRHYDFGHNLNAKYLLLACRCSNLSVKNIRFDNTPQYMTSGKVLSSSGGNLVAEIYPGCPVPEESRVYCCNAWDTQTKDLKEVASVTFSSDVNADPEAFIARRAGGSRIMITNADVASKFSAGDGISWHFGAEGVQTDFRFCNNLHLENLESNSALGFHFQASYCHGITAKKVRVCRRGNQLCVGSRDAFKIYLCSGSVDMEDLYVEGVRWDGQNVHGKLLYPTGKIDNYKISCTYHGEALEDILPGDKMGVWKDRDNEQLLTVADYSYTLGLTDRVCYVTFKEEIPDFLTDKSFLNVYSHVNDYSLKNSEFRNIAGCASIIRDDGAVVSGNRFYRIMYPAICFGGDLSNEGVSSKNATISGNEIDHCGWVYRGRYNGGIAAGIISQQKNLDVEPYVKNVTITGNRISNCPVGITLRGIDGAFVSGNVITSCGTSILKTDVKNSEIE